MNNIDVSVVVPVFNSELYLQSVIEDLTSQTLKNIEIIFVNDGSEDDSLSILKDAAKKDSRIRIIDGPREGAAKARNKGMHAACGDYIVFLDADDIFSHSLCELAYLSAKEFDSDIVIWDYATTENSKKLDEDRGNIKGIVCQYPLRSFKISNPAAWTKMYSRNFLEMSRLYFQDLSTCNDIGFVWSSLALARRIVYVPRCLVLYRYNAQGNISSSRSMFSNNIFKAGAFVLENLNKNKVSKYIKNRLYFDIVDCMKHEYGYLSSKEKKRSLRSK